jgi:hypothetical protein
MSEPRVPLPVTPAATSAPRSGGLHPLAVVAVATLLLLGVGLGALLGRCSRPPDPAPESRTVVRGTPAVVVAIRDLARLESSEFHIERVIDVKDKQSRLFGLVEADDAILLIAAGSVTAGVDLSKIRDQDIRLDETKRTASITLPPPQILSSRLDNEKSYVHTRKTDLLAERKESLETKARQEAEKSIREAATQSGILARARNNAKNTVTSLVRSLGYERIDVKFADE